MPFDFSERKKCWKEHAPLDEKVSYDSYNISFPFENESICRNKQATVELIDEHEDDQDETNDSDPNETTDQSSEDEPQTEEVCEFYCILSKMNSSG